MKTSFNVPSVICSLLSMITTIFAAPAPVNTSAIDYFHAGTLNYRDQIQTLTFTGSTITFQGCLPYNGNSLCTIAFVQTPSWTGGAQLFLYDHTCKSLGERSSITRTSLCAFSTGTPEGYEFNSGELSDPLWVYTTCDWDGTDNHPTLAYQGVMLSYKGVVMMPLAENLHGMAAWTNQVASDGSGTFMFWRGSFAMLGYS